MLRNLCGAKPMERYCLPVIVIALPLSSLKLDKNVFSLQFLDMEFFSSLHPRRTNYSSSQHDLLMRIIIFLRLRPYTLSKHTTLTAISRINFLDFRLNFVDIETQILPQNIPCCPNRSTVTNHDLAK